MKLALFRTHSGLGDHLVCNALVRIYAERYDRLYLPVKNPNIESVQWMYRDDPKIIVVPCQYDDAIEHAVAHYKQELGCEYIGVGYHGDGYSELLKTHPFDDAFYLQHGIEPDVRWEEFKVDLNYLPYAPSPDLENYAFVYSKGSDGNICMPDTKLPMRTATVTRNIFDHVPLIEHAAEIHCVPSSFYHLVDLLTDNPKQTLYLYQSARPAHTHFKRPWIVR